MHIYFHKAMSTISASELVSLWTWTGAIAPTISTISWTITLHPNYSTTYLSSASVLSLYPWLFLVGLGYANPLRFLYMSRSNLLSF